MKSIIGNLVTLLLALSSARISALSSSSSRPSSLTSNSTLPRRVDTIAGRSHTRATGVSDSGPVSAARRTNSENHDTFFHEARNFDKLGAVTEK